MKQSSVSSHNFGTFPSPGAPDYRDRSVGSQKGWSSERVPLPGSSSRRHISTAALTPFYSGRTLPSKWEDAERWICSPVLGYGASRTSHCQPQSQRPQRSKSGPLGPMGIAYYSNCSPSVPGLDGGSVRNFMVGSPFSTGVLGADGDGGLSRLVHCGNNVARSAGVVGWSDLLSEASLPSSQDEKPDGTKGEETIVSPVVSRRDMATQMSPKGSTHSSPKGKSTFYSSPPLLLPAVDPQSTDHPAEMELRDVQVDKRATMISWSKRHRCRMTKKSLPEVQDFTSEAPASSWDIAEAANDISKLQREEAKITAWENLQKANAEAAIRKLEMKLEKKRSSSMDRILNKLRIARMKAQEMRSSISLGQVHQVPKSSHRVGSFRKLVRLASQNSCFTSHAY